MGDERATAPRTPLRVRVVGSFSVEGLGERELGSRKGRLLLKALALARGRPVSTDRLVEVLWGDDQPARPGEQVGVLVSRLRGVLGPDRLVRTDAGYALRADWLDLDELAARVNEAADALDAGRVGAARAAAESALALARGPVLPEEDGDWVDVERAAVEALASAARRVAAEAALHAGDLAAAAARAEQALVHDPYDEAALRVLMRAHGAAGRPASALGAYARVRERLAEDLGLPPTKETEALHDEIVLAPPEPAAPAASLSPAGLHGRGDELATLESAFLRARTSGGASTVVVEGEPGIGKTALLEAWAGRVAASAFVLFGRCDELGRDVPMEPVVGAVSGHLGVLSLKERISALGSEGGVLGPLLGVETADTASGATVITDPELGRARLFAALCTVVARLADGRPVVLAVDDVHLAGPATVAWIGFALRRMANLLVVATARAASAVPLPADETISLGPLDQRAVAAAVGPERAEDLYARSGGHPLLLEALARASGEDDPTSVREAVERRVGGLGAAVGALRTAALLGADIDLDLLAGVLRAPAVELIEHLEAAAALGLLVERGTGFSFRHEVEREALAASTGAARRAFLHGEAARALAARPAPDPLAVAVHARLGDEPELAVEWYLKAAAVATARFDLGTAETLLDAALALLPSPPALIARARLRMATSRLDEAAEDAAQAVGAGGGAPALEVAGWVSYYRRRYDEAMACADRAVEQADDIALRVSCLALGGRVRHGAGDLRGAVERLETAVTEKAPAEVQGLAEVWLAQTRLHQGRPEDALAILRPALVAPDLLAHPFAPLHGRFARALALGQLGRVDEALRACDELDAAVARAGAAGTRFTGPAANVRAWIMRWTGLTEEADQLNAKAVAGSDPSGPRAEAYYAGLLDLADGRLLAGDPAGAAAAADRLAPIAEWGGTMAWHQRHRWRLIRARLALADGDTATAAGLSAEVVADASGRGARRYELLAAGVAALAGVEPAGGRAELDAVVQGLDSCAALDGWWLVASLAETLDVRTWRAQAERRAAAVVRASPHGAVTSHLVDGLLG